MPSLINCSFTQRVLELLLWEQAMTAAAMEEDMNLPKGKALRDGFIYCRATALPAPA